MKVMFTLLDQHLLTTMQIDTVQCGLVIEARTTYYTDHPK